MSTPSWHSGKKKVQKVLVMTIRRISLPCCVAIALASPLTVRAAPPTGAVVIEATPNTNIMIKRPNRTSIPASRDQKMRSLDVIIVPARSMSRATLKTIGPDLLAQLVGLSQRTAWRLPCEVSGSGFIAWGNGISRGCMPPGVVVRGNLERISAAPRDRALIASAAHGNLLSDSLAQITQFLRVCSVTDEQGENAHTMVSLFFSSPCATAMDRCEQAASSACMVVSEGEWTSSRSRAFALCGETIKKLRDQDALMGFLNSLVGQSTNCVVQVLSPGDSLLIPEGRDRTVVAFENEASGSVVSVIEGKIKIVSRKSDDWQSLSSGETYSANRGERRSTSDWLRESELCRDTERSHSSPSQANPIESTRMLDQAQNPYEPQPLDGNPFDSIYSQYCSQPW
jgi:hypothetical protein